jgi:hypothetical protein
MKATILLATMAMRAAADRSRSYAVLSSTRNDAADVTWLRNPKTATTAFVYGVMPLKPCGDRLRVSEKHEVGCARQACGDGDADPLRGIAGDQRDAAAAAAASNAIVTLREPVARFRSAWTFLRAKHPNATAWRRYACVADLARALGAFGGTRSVKGRVDAVAKVLAEKRSYKPFALWPQAYWYNPLLGPRNGSAVVVCYDGAAFPPGQEKGDSTSLQCECFARARPRKSIHASRALREMIARPKISRNEWKSAEKGAFEMENFAPFSCPGSSGGRRTRSRPSSAATSAPRRTCPSRRTRRRRR